MEISFTNFKQRIPSQILSRGREYLRRGNILDLSFDESERIWEAQVQGSELYEVRVEQAETGNLTCICTCPYELGECCKHVAAVLYAIEDMLPDTIGIKPRSRPIKRQTKHDQLRQALENTSRETLISVLLEMAQQNREILNQLVIRLDGPHLKPNDYRRVVKDAIRSGRDNEGFLDYAGSNRAARKIQELLIQADQWLQTGHTNRAMSVYQAVLDETIVAIAHSDDSSGLLGSCLQISIDGLATSVDLQDESGRKALFDYCIERATRQDFYSWDWGLDLLSIAASLVDTSTRRAMFKTYLEAIAAEFQKSDAARLFGNYQLEKLVLIELSLVDRLDGETAGLEFLRTHVHLDRPRISLIERCLAKGFHNEAMTHIQEGIATSTQRRLPGLAYEYKALQVELLRRNGDQRALIEAARDLWLGRGDEQTFDLLKKTVSTSEWQGFVEGLVNAVQDLPQRLAWLYVVESRWQDLMALIQSAPNSLWLVEEYRAPLESRFPDEMVNLYEAIIDKLVVRASNRNQYRQVVGYLKRIRSLGHSSRVQAIAVRLQKQFANRPALLDELSRI